ncbi:MAG TPA: YggS family pyridoxal phosphate-dependent enzyme [Bacteroidetes bacterium]|nr:YggS family pyridoxal phosphate-dependent enzyme [Bacteroidota bacterium]
MLEEILKKLQATGTKLIAVSKTKPVDAILELYNRGQRIFGENRVQELVRKQGELPADIEWHFIGHMQTNKVKYIAPFIACIHSIDSLKLLKEVNKQAEKNGRTIDCLLQFHIAEEETKFGLDLDEAGGLLSSDDFFKMKNVRIRGVMGMATFTEDEGQVRREFAFLKNIFDELKNMYFPDDPGFSEISMGMSGDYEIALEEGSTMVRLGTLLFGQR